MKAAGDVKFPTIPAIFSMWGVSALFAYILGIVCGMGLAVHRMLKAPCRLKQEAFN